MGRVATAGVFLLFLCTSCTPWPYDDPYDPHRCDPACDQAGGFICIDGQCKAKSASCGDGELQRWEACDGALLKQQTCKTQGFFAGDLACTGCKLDTSGCTNCGNAKLDDKEKCDGKLLGSLTCKGLGYRGGKPGCTKACKPDATNCYWLVTAGGVGGDGLYDMALDSVGNSYIAGSYNEDATFGTNTLPGTKWTDKVYYPNVFVAKLGPTGKFLWSTSARSMNSAYARGIATSKKHVLVTGTYNAAPVTFGNKQLKNRGAWDLFVAKLAAADGSLVWAVSAGAKGSQTGEDIAVDPAGNSYVVGTTSQTVSFGKTTLTSAGSTDVLVAKLDPDGKFVWATSAGGTGDDLGKALTLDAAGNVYITGGFSGTATFGSTTLTSLGSQDILVAKLDAAGKFVWATSAGSDHKDPEGGRGIVVDAKGNVTVAGWFMSTATFGTRQLTAQGAHDVFVARLSPAGKFDWVTTAGSDNKGQDSANDLLLSPAGDLYTTGSYTGKMDLPPSLSLQPIGGYDAFVARLDSSGKFVSAISAGGTEKGLLYNSDLGYALTMSPSGRVIVGGSFTVSATFNGEKITGKGDKDVFVWGLAGDSL